LPYQFIVSYHAFCTFARKISQLYLSIYDRHSYSENSTADARRLVNYLNHRQISTIKTVTIKSAILLFYPSFYTCASLTSSSVIPSSKVVFQVPAYLYCAVQHLRDLNRRVEVILHAVSEKQLWIHRAVCERPAISSDRVFSSRWKESGTCTLHG